MRVISYPAKRLALDLLLLLAIYTVCRLGFIIQNHQAFNNLSPSIVFKICFWGIRYDLSAILILNSLYGIILLAPIPIWRVPELGRSLNVLFFLTNIPALLIEIGDWGYFPYNLKRSTAAVFDLITRKGDFLFLLPGWLIQYWYLLAGAIIILLSLWFVKNQINQKTPLTLLPEEKPYTRIFLIKGSLLLGFIFISVICVRGGLQYIPIGIRNATQTSGPEYAPALLNTPFSILTTIGGESVKEVYFFNTRELNSYVNPIKGYPSNSFKSRNVVIIILESFSREFTALGKAESYTPFLDSLMNESLVCTNAFANGLRSAEGIPAILAGIPSLMDEPFHTSPFSSNRINGIPSLLKTKGYESSFFHGGTNGTMAFDGFAPSAGFNRYIGRNEYNNEKDYDGHWGIWDKPFLEFYANSLKKMKQPFVSSVFTLTSHPPYLLPDNESRKKFPAGKNPIHACIRYTDDALRNFFRKISGEKWFSNTLFIITADHASPIHGDGFWGTPHGKYAIPLIFFSPADKSLKGETNILTQQIDILPSVMDYLGYENGFFAFGHSIFRKEPDYRLVINQNNGVYTFFDKDNLMVTEDFSPLELYNLQIDSFCRKNMISPKNSNIKSNLLEHLKANIQSYRMHLIQNKMWVRN